MSHLRLVNNDPIDYNAAADAAYWDYPVVEIETPPPVPREAVQTAAIDDIFGDIFTPGTRTPAKTATPTPKTPTIEELEAMLPPAILNRMREAMRPTPPVETPPPMPREAGHIPYQYQGRQRRRFTRTSEPRIITARFPSRCNETGNLINTGDKILWYPDSKSVYCLTSDRYTDYVNSQTVGNYISEGLDEH